jgi:hypothetical protein
MTQLLSTTVQTGVNWIVDSRVLRTEHTHTQTHTHTYIYIWTYIYVYIYIFVFSS